jgi:hypothetical protein
MPRIMTSSTSSTRATGIADWITAIAVARVELVKTVETAHRGRHRLRQRMKLHGDFGDDSKRAFGADE